jgi:putative SOS response-associated peptidase YedK
MLTTEPGPDVARIQNRQVVVLRPRIGAAWMRLSKPENELLKPLTQGSLAVETVRKGSD